jgi:hypothetical protein
MNGFRPDRPQRMAQMLAMQERNRSIGAPPGQRDGMPAMRPSLAYSGATPNTASGVPPQAMNFNGPQMTPQPGMGGMAMEGVPGRASGAMMARPQMGMPRMPPQIGGQPMRPRQPASPGLTTPQGGSYRGDFENAS